MSLKTPLKRVRGLGSAKAGLHHWWAQRLTAIALVPLSIWFVVSLLRMSGEGYFAAVEWIRQPLVASLFLALILAGFYHAALGVQVVIEDYIHTKGTKFGLIILSKGLIYFLAIVASISVLKIAFLETVSL